MGNPSRAHPTAQSKALVPSSVPSAKDFWPQVATRPYGTRGCNGSPHNRTPTSGVAGNMVNTRSDSRNAIDIGIFPGSFLSCEHKGGIPRLRSH